MKLLEKLEKYRHYIIGTSFILFAITAYIFSLSNEVRPVHTFIVVIGLGNIFKVEIIRKVSVFLVVFIMIYIPFLYFPMFQIGYETSLTTLEQSTYTTLTEALAIAFLLLLKNKYKKPENSKSIRE
ncbi:hypothetical protein [Halobacteriovorax sp. RT-1-4]|uniref:hypothetical protein n=1 Tax=unclassified Halobacteriovorax TaxID=2639665 RepID=UPI00399A4358